MSPIPLGLVGVAGAFLGGPIPGKPMPTLDRSRPPIRLAIDPRFAETDTPAGAAAAGVLAAAAVALAAGDEGGDAKLETGSDWDLPVADRGEGGAATCRCAPAVLTSLLAGMLGRSSGLGTTSGVPGVVGATVATSTTAAEEETEAVSGAATEAAGSSGAASAFAETLLTAVSGRAAAGAGATTAAVTEAEPRPILAALPAFTP